MYNSSPLAKPASTAALLTLASPALAADEPPEGAPKGAAVTVFKAAKACFNNIVEVSGILIPREETSVRSERPGLKVAEVLAEPGDTVTAGQLAGPAVPARGRADAGGGAGRGAGLGLHRGGRLDGGGQGRGAVFHHRAQRIRPGRHGAGAGHSKLAVNQPARVKIIGAGEVDGRVRRVAPTVEPNSQLGQVFSRSRRRGGCWSVRPAGGDQAPGRAATCSVPLTSILYGTTGTVVQVVRRGGWKHRRVEVGLMSAGQVEDQGGPPWKATSWWCAPARCCARAIRCGR